MARFIYRMQNILDIKYKLEESARQEYSDALAQLNLEEEKLAALHLRKTGYYNDYLAAIEGKLDYLNIESCANAMDVMDDMIANQNTMVKKRSRELEKARVKLNQVMQERKMHEKLKEKKFDEFMMELNAAENKETDQLVSYRYNAKSDEDMEG